MFWTFLLESKVSVPVFLNIVLKKVPTGPAETEIGNIKTIKTKNNFLGLIGIFRI